MASVPELITPGGIKLADERFPFELGLAVGCALRAVDEKPHIILGKNTAHENYAIEGQVVSGLVRAGIRVTQTGPLPVPALTLLTPSMRADLGMFISGGNVDGAVVRFIDGRHKKIGDDFWTKVGALLGNDPLDHIHDYPVLLAKNTRIEDAQGRYVELAKAQVPDEREFDKIRVVIDCANGAAYKVAPMAFYELGAECHVLNNDPNGTNLEKESGFREPKQLSRKVLEIRADFGVAFNADGDQVVVVDQEGRQAGEGTVESLLRKNFSGKLSTDCLIQTLQLLHVCAKSERRFVFPKQ